MRIVGQIQFWRSCKIVFFWEAVWLFSIFFYFFSSSLFLLLFPQLGAAPAPTSPPSPSSSPKKHWIFERGHTVWGRGVSRLVVIALRIFFLFMLQPYLWTLKKVSKHILFSLLSQYITCLQSSYTIQITGYLSKVAQLFFCVYLVTLRNVLYKKIFIPY